MAGKGRKVIFHGAFSEKAAAVRKEKKVGGYIKEIRVKGHKRYAVITRRKGK